MQSLKRFYSLITPYWLHPRSGFMWLLLLTLVGLTLAVVWISVQYNNWSREFYDAMTDYFQHTAVTGLVLSYAGLTVLFVLCIISANWLKKLLIIRWRQKMTLRFQSTWLRRHNHYRLSLGSGPDNPDQRIAEDIQLLIEQSLELFLSLLKNTTRLFSFIFILWQLSDQIRVTVSGYSFIVHGYLVWIALIYATLSSLLAHKIGRPLHKLNIEKQKTEADYRAGLLRIRENTEQIAFYRGERAELRRAQQRFRAIVRNWQQLMLREFKLESFTTTYFRLSLMIPIFAVLPLYIAKKISFGGVMQARSAFGYVLDAFGWFIDSYRQIVAWSATVERLWEFEQHLRNLPARTKEPRYSQQLVCRNLVAYHGNGYPLFDPVSLSLQSGDSIAITGASGSGKTTFLRTLSGLWPFCSGSWNLPPGKSLFIPQKPYLPYDTLWHVLTYPGLTYVTEEQVIICMKQVGLTHLSTQLNERKLWSHILSGGEQQRVSFARILLSKPALICLDESTSHLDDNSALRLIRLIQSELPESIILAVSHQVSVMELFARHQAIQLDATEWDNTGPVVY
ncbi:ABC transporter ATP-binding protein/permease [Klebsiella sp. BIGb0407]|uniref:ABC transporter ATP-binding protein/permease n=1 Tax=Klebsiella sp. BIGb0407 TaxID=2940603 RepID=UPI00216AA946|nr:ABC transporter ATP-binding protein/permease [Klebsiella sp. BIGb0407]MCS3433474.1 putative ATP-binding cassette transporter [Klebsiella sp. BIGb0407]